MPQVLRIGPYILYFWSNENDSLEPVHIYISQKDELFRVRQKFGSQARGERSYAIIIQEFLRGCWEDF